MAWTTVFSSMSENSTAAMLSPRDSERMFQAFQLDFRRGVLGRQEVQTPMVRLRMVRCFCSVTTGVTSEDRRLAAIVTIGEDYDCWRTEWRRCWARRWYQSQFATSQFRESCSGQNCYGEGNKTGAVGMEVWVPPASYHQDRQMHQQMPQQLLCPLDTATNQCLPDTPVQCPPDTPVS
ncbi:hypothetical protein F0562_008916 [Nyssa sinensis]|uniref:Uncharacterized protein n=1 Tax=Nyssa sinensis TaxID=561372 RepID=A0A5J5A6X8_9ASTE|nr:hypothetical protein F0562_008916 [Nyssa sinensis]